MNGDLAARIRQSVAIDGNGCWIWQKATGWHGYGVLNVNGLMKRAHRLAYEAFKGPIAPNLVIDHLCRVKQCCNPDHLEAVTQWENTKRGTNFMGAAASATHCKHGHPFIEQNIYWHKGHRNCIACRRIAQLKYREAVRANP